MYPVAGENLTRWAVKSVMSGLFYYSGVVWLFSRLKRIFGKTSITILTYHSVSDEFNYLELFMGVDKFRGQIEYLAGLGSVVSMADAEVIFRSDRKREKNLFVLTFDDGYRDNFLNAYPILREYGVSGTIYLTTGCIQEGRPPFAFTLIIAVHRTIKLTIDLGSYGLGIYSLKCQAEKEKVIRSIDRYSKTLADIARQKFQDDILRTLGFEVGDAIFKNWMLNWEDVRAMSDCMSFGGHTVTHPVLSSCSAGTAKTEIEQCKRDIERETGRSIKSFAYPYGGETDINDDIVYLVQKTGYSSAVVLYRNPHTPENMFKLGRIMVSNAMTSRFFDNRFSRAMFACEMSGLFDLILRRNKGKELRFGK